MPDRNKIGLIIAWIVAIIVVVYSLGTETETVYSHVFYLLIVLTAIWQFHFLIPTAIVLGILEIVLHYGRLGAISAVVLEEALLMLTVAAIVAVARGFYEDEDQDEVIAELISLPDLIGEKSSLVLWILNLDTMRWDNMSTSIKNLTGYTAEEIVGLPVKETLSRKELLKISDKMNERISRFRRGEKESNSFLDKIQNTRKDGTKIWVEFNSKLLTNKRGQLVLLGIARDISEQYEMEKDLQYKNDIVNSLLDNIPSLLTFLDDQGSIVMASATTANILGTTRKEAEGKMLTELVSPDLADVFLNENISILESGQSISSVNIVMTKDHGPRAIEMLSFPFITHEGHTRMIGIIGNDITERQKMEESIITSEARWNHALEGAGEGVWDWDVRTDKVFYSKRWKEMLGFEEDEITDSPKEWRKRIHPDDRKSCFEAFDKILQGDSPSYQLEYRLRTKDGSYKWFLDKGKLVERNADGSPLRVIGSHADITERRKTEDRISKQTMEIIALTNNMSDFIARYDRNLRYSYTNQRKKNHRLLGRTNRELGMPEPNVTNWENALRRTFLSGKQQMLESSNDGPRGRKHYHSIFTPEFFGTDEVMSVITTTREITEIKELEVALRMERQNLYTTLESIGEGVISTNNQNQIILLNRVAQQLSGWTIDEARNRSFAEVFNIREELTSEEYSSPEQVFNNASRFEGGYHTVLISKQGVEIPVEYTASPILDEGKVMGVVVVFRDVSDKKEKQREILYLSYHDQLTGLYNRRFFEEELNRLDTERNLPLSIIVADVNGLKLANDAFGHQFGDELLQRVAIVLKSECRADDIVSRMGGDEFYILLPQTSSDEANKIVERIKTAATGEKVGLITLSFAIAWGTKEEKEQPISTVLLKAEDEMYQNKKSESLLIRINMIKELIKALYLKTPWEENHSVKVSQLCVKLGRELGLSSEAIRNLRVAGLLHDIGRITVDDMVTLNSESLNDLEWEEMKRHPENGFRMLSSVGELTSAARYVLAHHERWDGNGYPQGLIGPDIPFGARIIAIADAYDAMTAARPYSSSMSHEEAIEELRRNSGTQFDPNLTSLFIEKVAGSDHDQIILTDLDILSELP